MSTLSACGPPVEAPITSTRGTDTGIGRKANGGRATPASAGRLPRIAAALPAPCPRARMLLDSRRRFARSPSVRIFSISSRRKLLEPPSSWLDDGFGI